MGSLVSHLTRDVRYGLRLLAKSPGFTVVAVLTLALGIGATSAIFTVLDAAVLSPLPFRDPGQLVWVQEVNGRGATRSPSAAAGAEWGGASRTVEAMGGVGGLTQYSLSGPAGARRVSFGQVSLDTLAVLGVEPALGRWFQPDEVIVEGNTAETIVISHGLWQSHFGGDPDVIGKPLPGWNAAWGRIVIGVMPPGFWIHPSMSGADGWFAFDYPRMQNARPSALARLGPGVSLDEAQAELAAIADRPDSGTADPEAESWRVELVPLHDVFTSGYANALYLLLGAVSFVLLIAAANVTNLQLGRGVARGSEMSTRAALGANRGQLLGQLLSESLLLGLMGGALGVLVAFLGVRIFVILAPQFYPPSQDVRMDGSVLLFALAVSLAAGVLSGLVPALRASRPDLTESLKQGARGTVAGARQGIRRFLVVAEVALAVVLLVGAGLMINSYVRVTNVDMGLNPDNVLTMEVSMVGQDRYRTRNDQGHFTVTPAIAAFYTDVIERIGNLPGVSSVAVTSYLPPGVGPAFPVRVVGAGAEAGDIPTQYHEVSAAYFETMEIPLGRGRAFTDLDSENAPGVAILNETAARQLFGDQEPLGAYVQVNLGLGNPDLDGDRPREIVGVVGDSRLRPRDAPVPLVYVPYQQHLTDYASNVPFFVHAHKDFVVRTGGDPASLAPAVRQVVADVDPAIAADGLMSMRERLAQSAVSERFWTRLLGLFAALAVFLAAMGIYGVISYAVVQRTHEFGVRIALGARRSDILKLVAREALLLTLAGLTVGIAGAFASTRLIANQLYGVTPMDPATIAAVVALLIAVAFLACYVPARRASGMDPLAAIRVE